MLLKDKKILVTGGAGFIGSHIVDRLVNLGANVVVLDDLSAGKLENLSESQEKIEFIKGDIRNENDLEVALDGVEYVCHQAAIRSVPKSINRPLEYNDVNVVGTLKLFLKAHAVKVKRILYASSSSVYGERINFPEKESDCPHPVSPYSVTKLFGEYYANIFNNFYGIEVVSLRYFNVFGPRQSLEDKYSLVVPKLIDCLLKEESPPIYDDGEQERDFTYVENVVEANILALTKKSIAGEVFNVANGDPKSVNYLLACLNKIIGKNIKATYFDVRLGDVRKTYADMQKAKKLLNFYSKVDFIQGLEETVKWFKNR